MSGNKNLIIAFALSFLVLAGWQWFVALPQMRADQAHQAEIARQEKAKPAAPQTSAQTPAPGANLALPQSTGSHMSREAALKAGGDRVAIDTPMLDGSIALKGAKFDDLRLKKYRDTLDPKSAEIVLLAPKGTDDPYYAEFGWIGSGGNPAMPNDQTPWTLKSGTTLSPGRPVTLTWDNGQGLVFTRTIAIDDKYMFTVSDSVANTAGPSVTLYPFAYVAREGAPKETSNLALHVGFVGIAGDSLKQAGYKDFKADTPPTTFSSITGWLGINDKYWMAAVIPPQGETFNAAFLGSNLPGGAIAYQANYRLGPRNLAPGASTSVTHRMFAGAKVVDTLRAYETSQHIAHFDEAVDWGPWLWVFTRPIFWLLDMFYKVLGNFGLAILALTVVVKLLFFPLANAQFKSMSKMKKVQPEMERIKKLHSGDPQKQQLAIMELYKQEKLNPLAGCLPILIQIPVFFSLYKVLYVTIEMRQAPFYGWIHDLSAPDPTSIINLFGLLPFDPHAILPGFLAILSIGVWPVLYGITMFVQTKLNPAPPDPVQAQMLTYMPLIFTFFFGTFPAGLVIYYVWNTLLTIAQQWFIMRKEGVEVPLLDNLWPRRNSG